MCGITAIINAPDSENDLRKKTLLMSKKVRHRGPDDTGIRIFKWKNKLTSLAHERLSIVDPFTGKQPLQGSSKSVACIINGEIYNYQQLKKILLDKFGNKFSSNSDSQVVPFLYEQFGNKFVNKLDGVFALVVVDAIKHKVFIARDPIGICPLYIGTSSNSSIIISSELKALKNSCNKFEIFPPGHFGVIEHGELPIIQKYYNPEWHFKSLPHDPLNLEALETNLINAVRKRLMGDVPIGVLLSGGLDSSLVASIAKRLFDKLPTDKRDVGFNGSPDLAAARQVADYIGTKHHEFVVDLQDAIDAIPDVIYHLESYDIYNIRAGVPLYLLSRFIQSLGIKVVLSGEGADEVFGGYKNYHEDVVKISPDEFQNHLQERIENLHVYDILRANKCGMAWGLEIRVPFLDLDFLNCVMKIHPENKLWENDRIEKWCLRSAFENKKYIPDEILWRVKAGFSNGVGDVWKSGLLNYSNEMITDEQMKKASIVYPRNPPETKEAYLYRSIFQEIFPSEHADLTVHEDWSKSFKARKQTKEKFLKK